MNNDLLMSGFDQNIFLREFMNHKITRYLVLFAISILFSACQTSKFKDCKSLYKLSSEAIPFYKDKK